MNGVLQKTFLSVVCAVLASGSMCAMQCPAPHETLVSRVVERDIAAAMNRAKNVELAVGVRLVNVTRLRQLYRQSCVQHSYAELDQLEKELRTLLQTSKNDVEGPACCICLEPIVGDCEHCGNPKKTHFVCNVCAGQYYGATSQLCPVCRLTSLHVPVRVDAAKPS